MDGNDIHTINKKNMKENFAVALQIFGAISFCIAMFVIGTALIFPQKKNKCTEDEYNKLKEKKLRDTFLTVIAFFMFQFNSFAQVLPTPTTEGQNDNSDLTTGMRFKTKQKSIISGVMYFRGMAFTGNSYGHLWDDRGNLLAQRTFPANNIGWNTLSFTSPVIVDSGKTFIVSFSNDGGWYCGKENYFPRSFTLYDAITSNYSWTRNSFPQNSYKNINYFVEPVIQKYIEQPIFPPCETKIVRDTVKFFIDTCTIDYSKLQDLQFVLMLPEEGGKFILPDSTVLYNALFGTAQPHVRMKDDTSIRADRFYRGTGVNRRRVTLYNTGAWIVEKYVVNKWVAMKERYKNGVWVSY